MHPLRLALALAAVLGAAAYLAFGTGPFLRWLAAAVLLGGAFELRPWARLAARPRLVAAAPYLVLAVLLTVLLGDLLLGRPPASRDHAIHYFQTELLVHDLVPAGHLRGWSDRLGNGYTLGDSYPVLGYLWMGAAHLLSFGLVPLRASYALGILAMWLLAAGGVFRLAARIAGEVLPRADISTDVPKKSTIPWPAWAGCLGSAFWLLDTGASREGGWEYLMFHGVWPQLLATSLWISALPATSTALARPSPRRIALAGLLLGLAVLAHPFALLMAGSSAAAWAVLLVLRPAAAAAGRWRVFLLVHALAAAICVGWLAGFLASADTMGRAPVPWHPWGELATRLVSGELFAAHRAWVGPLALLGLGLALRRGAALAWLTAGLLLATLVLASDAAITVLRLDLLVSAFKNIQFPRYAIVLKPLWYALAGVGAAIVTLWAVRSWHLQQSPTTGQNPITSDPTPKFPSTTSQLLASRPLAWTASILLAPILSGSLEDLGRLAPTPIGAKNTLENSPHGDLEDQLHAALAAEKTTHGPLKIAHLRTGMSGATYPMFAIADVHADLVLDGHIPSINSVYRIRDRSPALLRGLGVTHVLHDRPLPKKEKPLADALEPLTKIGPYTLARLKPVTNPRTIPGLATWTTAGQQVTPTRHDPHALDLEVTARGPLQLLASPDRHWHATFIPADGAAPEPLPLTPIHLYSGALTGTRVDLPGPGRLELRYLTPDRERLLGWLSLAAILAALAALAFRRPLEFAERLHAPAARRISLALTALAAALVLALAVRRQSHQLARTWEPLLKNTTFVADLVDQGAHTVKMRPADTCDGIAGKDAHHGCSRARDRPRRAFLFRDPYIYRCLWLTIPPRGRTTVTFDPPAGTTVRGLIDRRTPGGKPNKKLHYTIGKDKQPLKDRMERFEGRTLELTNGAGDLEHVCIAAAAVTP